MKNTIIVMNTDQVNRYCMQFPVAVLYSVLQQTWNAGNPMFISHDMHRPIGWSAAMGIALYGDVAYLLGQAGFPDTAEEERTLNEKTQVYVQKKLARVEPESRARLERAAADRRKPEASFMSRECATLVQEGIAKDLFPDLFPERENDKRGLIPLSTLQAIGPGVYEVREGICVFAHRYLRRSASRWNNLNVHFLRQFQHAAAHCKDFDARIALDPDAIGLADSYREGIELEYWWGPHFSDYLSDIKTQITRHVATTREREFHGIDRTEFWWYDQDSLRAFECEEVVDGQTLGLEGADRYACRYAHSMLDLDRNEPHHLDGAVRIYDDEQILRRHDLNMAEAGRHSEYVKLWRVDGRIPVSLWKALVSDYFRDNHLVSEYLGAKRGQADTAVEAAPLSQRSLAPFEFNSDASPVLLLSIHPTTEERPQADIDVRSDTVINQGEDSFRTIDMAALNVVKRLQSVGLRVQLPQSFEWVAYEDMHIELPRMCVTDVSAASKMLNAVATEFRDWAGIGGHSVSGCIDLVSSQHRLRAAFLGMPMLVAQRLQSLSAAVAVDMQDGVSMLDAWRAAGNSRPQKDFELLPVVRDDGSLDLGRKFIPGAIPFMRDANVAIRVPETLARAEGIEADLREGRLLTVPVFKVIEAACNVCGKSFFACGCRGSKTMQKIELLGAVWTRHPSRRGTSSFNSQSED